MALPWITVAIGSTRRKKAKKENLEMMRKANYNDLFDKMKKDK
jgi:hypothetical protein